MASNSLMSLTTITEALRNLKIPLSQVKPFTTSVLGCGAYGKVFEVEYDGKLCAGKEIHGWMVSDEFTSKGEQQKVKVDFLRECHLWSTLRHPNVVLFLGIYYPSDDESGLPVMLMEKMRESVTSLVERHDDIPLLVKLSILHDVSLGLRYLHGRSPPIVHRDLSPNNILVTPHLEAKITDLGVAKAMITGARKTMTQTPGTLVFMAPEALQEKPVYGPPLDVFSFGGVILHITTQQWPDPKGV
ncbi:dual specificity protein kinase shkA-like [Dysidea avara]|uniref:dual specificity protein kinase shkA-like n=1 Tax=Dysidea avara TaxID=196820 RepID=UPI00332BE75B